MRLIDGNPAVTFLKGNTMQTRSFAKAPKFAALQQFAVVVQTGSEADIAEAFASLRSSPLFATKGWQKAMTKFAAVIGDNAIPFSILAKGNSKLPFYAFSTLPGVTCPGAGECLAFCYSFRAWRYPSAFFRQAQNAYLMRFNRRAILGAMGDVVRQNPTGFDFRLYVDGDFSNVYDIEFWMQTLTVLPNVKAYGYSKSFALLKEFVESGGYVPVNYKLNISSGHNASAEVVDFVRQQAFTRGDFVAVSIGRKIKAADYGTKPVNDALRAIFDSKVFPCPGKCGTCTSVGHACGSDVFKGKVIAIAVH
jgi:hypothetical protein